MENIPLCDAQRELGAVIDLVVTSRKPLFIGRDGGEPVVMVAAGEWAAIQRMALRSGSPVNQRAITARPSHC